MAKVQIDPAVYTLPLPLDWAPRGPAMYSMPKAPAFWGKAQTGTVLVPVAASVAAPIVVPEVVQVSSADPQTWRTYQRPDGSIFHLPVVPDGLLRRWHAEG